MERAVAEQLMRAFLATNEPLNSATVATVQIAEKDEPESLRRGIGNVMRIVYVELVRPIIKQYPDLDPGRP